MDPCERRIRQAARRFPAHLREDLCQEARLAVWQAQAVDPPLVYTVAYRAMVDAQRQWTHDPRYATPHTVKQWHPLTVDPAGAPDPADEAAARDLARRYAALPTRQRLAAAAVHGEARRLADLWGVSESRVAQLRRQAFAALT